LPAGLDDELEIAGGAHAVEHPSLADVHQQMGLAVD
jgi:hypothetical protein